MNKFILSILVCLIVTACGQKGPLIVEQPAGQNGQLGVEGIDGNDQSESSLNRQLEGAPIIIYR